MSDDEIIKEASNLLWLASWALGKMGLEGHGSDIGLPHELRMFALAFSREERDGPGLLQIRGNGRYDKLMKAIRERKS